MASYQLTSTPIIRQNINNEQLSKSTNKNKLGSFEKSLKVENDLRISKSKLDKNNKIYESNNSPQLPNLLPSATYSKNYLNHRQNQEVDGMNLAIKEKTDALAETVVGILLNFAMNTDESSIGSFAEGIYKQEATSEYVSSVAGDLVEDLSTQFYEESLRNESNRQKAVKGNSSE